MHSVNMPITVEIVGIILLLTMMTISSFSERIPEDGPPFLDYFEPVTNSVVMTVPQVMFGVVRHQTMSFYAFGREFRLQLEYKSDVYVPDAEVTIHWGRNNTTRQPIKDFSSNFVNGRLADDKTSSIIGSFSNGNFEGIIFTHHEIYYVEPSSLHFNTSQAQRYKFKSIIFRSKDINQTKVMCGPRDSGLSKSECMRGRLGSMSGGNGKDWNKRWVDRFYAKVEAQNEDESYSTFAGSSICMLKLYADHTFFQNGTDHRAESAIMEMRLILAEASEVFKQVDFDSDGNAEAFDFQVKNVELIYAADTPNYKMDSTTMAIDEFLSEFSSGDFDEYCLAVAFTYRVFPSGIMGYAFSASLDARRPGGICQKRSRAQKGYYEKSYNSIVITVINTAREIMPRHTIGMHLIHEFGHAFGAPHDDLSNDECSPPTAKGGKFIMSPVSLTWKEKNNHIFSRCSLNAMRNIILKKGDCLTFRQPICGNTVLEGEEECDCGNRLQCDAIDHCCTPNTGGIAGDVGCSVRVSEGRICSPRTFPCCTEDCQVTPAHQEKDCSRGNDCVYPMTCSGTSYQCPEAVNRPPGTECRNGLGRCFQGQCKDYLCSIKKMFECNCTEPRYMCQLCCKVNDSEICEPATRVGLKTLTNSPFYKPVGERCMEGRGYCSHGGTCISEFGYLQEEEDEETSTTPSSQESEDKEPKTLVTILVLVGVALAIAILIIVVLVLYFFTPVGNKFTAWYQTRKGK